MRDIKSVLKKEVTGNFIRSYICEGCHAEVKVEEMPIIGGPNKGKIEEMHVGCICEDLALAQSAKLSHIKSRIRHYLGEKSLINEDLRNASFETFDFDIASPSQIKAIHACKEYINEFNMNRPRNLLLNGNTGVGKSHIALATLRYLMERKKFNGIFITLPLLLRKIKNTYNKNDTSGLTVNEILTSIRDIDLLVLDDLGAESGTNHDITTVFEILDSRLGKHNIFTTNLNYDQFVENFGERNASRVLRNTKIIKVKRKDDLRIRNVNLEEWL